MNNVPNEIVKEILKYGDGELVKIFALTSHRYNSICSDQRIWKHLFERNHDRYYSLFKLYTTDWKNTILIIDSNKIQRLKTYLIAWFKNYCTTTLSSSTLEYTHFDVRFRDNRQNTLYDPSSFEQLAYIDCWLIWILPVQREWILFNDVITEWLENTDKKFAELFPKCTIYGYEHYSNSSQSQIFRIMI